MRRFKTLVPVLLLTTSLAQAQGVLQVEGQKSPGHRMKMKKSGVPAYPLYSKEKVYKNGKEKLVYSKVQNIPRLNVGVEGSLDTSALTSLQLPERPRSLKAGIKVPTRPVKEVQLTPLNIVPVQKARITSDIRKAPKRLPASEKIEIKISELLESENPKAKALHDFSSSRLKLLQGLIFLEEAEDYPLAMGLFAELQSDKEVGQEAQFYLGVASNKLGLKAEFRKRMLVLVKDKNSAMRKAALKELLAHIPTNDFHLANEILPHIEPLLGTEVINPRFSLVKAKVELDAGKLASASEWLGKIDDTAKEANERRFLESVIAYRTGRGQEARTELEKLLAVLKDKEKDLRSLAALTLARLNFQIGEYQKAYNAYLKVDKLHPLWMESLVEQSWSQILAHDYEGAAGNMFSLHTELFKNAFKPESHITRTVAYVNLCQYGDALTVLKQFKQKYAPTYKSLQTYQSKNKGKDHYYELVKSFLTTDGDADVNGVPRSFLFEFARHPQFMGLQGEINALEDERTTLDSVYGKLIEIERVAIKETSAIQKQSHVVRTEIIEATSESKKKNLKAKLERLERKVLSYEIKRYIANKSRNAVKELREEGHKVLAKEEAYYRGRAAEFLAGRFDQLSGQLRYLLEQGDLLQYEIFSGAGEHLRYQLAGGEVQDKAAKPVQVAEDEAMKWKFKGEIWEDEVGFFRSSLKNVCPPEDVAQR